VGQTISIDPKMWATIRKLAFDRQTTASKIVEAALTEWFDRENGVDKLRAGSATLRENHNVPKPIARVVSVETSAKGVTIAAAPWDEPETPKDDLPPPAVVIEDGEYKLTPEALARKAEQIAASKGREFHPVPKPTSRKPSTRSRRP
jgi:predicted transcriptional regulator